jgi:hypothetical protein
MPPLLHISEVTRALQETTCESVAYSAYVAFDGTACALNQSILARGEYVTDCYSLLADKLKWPIRAVKIYTHLFDTMAQNAVLSNSPKGCNSEIIRKDLAIAITERINTILSHGRDSILDTTWDEVEADLDAVL